MHKFATLRLQNPAKSDIMLLEIKIKKMKYLDFNYFSGDISEHRLVFRNTELPAGSSDKPKRKPNEAAEIMKDLKNTREAINRELVAEPTITLDKEQLQKTWILNKDVNIRMKKKYGVGLALKGETVVVRSKKVTKNNFVMVDVIHHREYTKKGEAKTVVYHGLVKLDDLDFTGKNIPKEYFDLKHGKKRRRPVRKVASKQVAKPSTPSSASTSTPSSAPDAPITPKQNTNKDRANNNIKRLTHRDMPDDNIPTKKTPTMAKGDKQEVPVSVPQAVFDTASTEGTDK